MRISKVGKYLIIDGWRQNVVKLQIFKLGMQISKIKISYSVLILILKLLKEVLLLLLPSAALEIKRRAVRKYRNNRYVVTSARTGIFAHIYMNLNREICYNHDFILLVMLKIKRAVDFRNVIIIMINIIDLN